MHLGVCFLQDSCPPSTVVIHLEGNRCAGHLEHWQSVIDYHLVIRALVPKCHLEHSFLIILLLSEYIL